ncbi:hypothetical protein RM550_20495 [Streptomyces sp. DSM 41527]|uniref:Uncharacterized protein n=1 Tax=Streptomyces mooreae TaxID=3075523 RepID=A0ABU2TAY5_9ACTN|nr:hypothetical protein [Streptomyces sp. DSM 41527]MDT0458088.1 hypothetical protein [Streptomyces sp. DSM 41527]
MTEEDVPPPAWSVTVGRKGLEVRGGRHLRVSVSPGLLSWIIGAAGTIVSNPLWRSFVG